VKLISTPSARSLLFAVVCLVVPVAPTHAADLERPNVVFILADDLGWRDLACYGSSFYETPHIDALAASGMQFENAYAASPVCSPTRASLLTGQHPARHGITSAVCHSQRVLLEPKLPKTAGPARRVIQPMSRTRLPNEMITYAEVLKAGGYRTAFLGKWHVGKAPYLPEAQGFDTVVGGRGFRGPPGGYFAPWKSLKLPSRPKDTHIDDALTDEAIRFLAESRDRKQPFLLNLWFYSVHPPFQAKPPLLAKYRAKAMRDPHDPQASPVMGAMIETLDANVGRILAALTRLGFAEQTVVLFSSDNGGDTHNLADGVQVTNNAPLRSGKGNIHEGGQRVPFIVRWPGRVAPGSKHPALVTSVDFFPSILEMAGQKLPPEQVTDGETFLPLLVEPEPRMRDRAIFTHFPHRSPAAGMRPATSVRRGDWKLVRYYADDIGQQDRYALYDLAMDSSETTDLSAKKPDVVRELASLIENHLEVTGALVPRANPSWLPSHDDWAPSPDASLALNRRDGTLEITASGDDPYIRTTGILAARGRFTVELRARSKSAGKGRLYFGDQGQLFEQGRSVAFDLTHDDQWQRYRVSFSTERTLGKLRFDPGHGPGSVELDWLRVIHWQPDGTGIASRHWDF
jgi:arylsulfatase A-like enzyme